MGELRFALDMGVPLNPCNAFPFSFWQKKVSIFDDFSQNKGPFDFPPFLKCIHIYIMFYMLVFGSYFRGGGVVVYGNPFYT